MFIQIPPVYKEASEFSGKMQIPSSPLQVMILNMQTLQFISPW